MSQTKGHRTSLQRMSVYRDKIPEFERTPWWGARRGTSVAMIGVSGIGKSPSENLEAESQV